MTPGRRTLHAAACHLARPLWRRLRPRLEAIAREQVAPIAERSEAAAARLHSDLDSLRGELRAEVSSLGRRLDDLDSTVEWLNGEHRRIAPQLAAVESRLAEVEHRLGRTGCVEGVAPDELGHVTALVDEIRSEHARVRTRLSLVARYEERLTRLEETRGA
ncbi:hypothetical protein [Actinokineospora enzanensis]|uniref:hypothetical protein n=1 Tax=Actinokineospora enzanensis TaxID=155975 RepID=UPI0012EB734A|nr:hypothetical protein [Actinokineospora enzanensis]